MSLVLADQRDSLLPMGASRVYQERSVFLIVDWQLLFLLERTKVPES